MEDDQIIAMFFSRSELAVDALADKYGRSIGRVLRNILRREQDAEECVNDTYMAVWNAIPPKRPSSLAGYVLRTARNLAMSRCRNDGTEKRGSSYEVALDELAECLPSAETVESAYGVRELRDDINAFLGSLRHEDRVIFVRRYWFADPVTEIAKLLGLTPNRVSVRLFRTREKLRLYLTERGVTV